MATGMNSVLDVGLVPPAQFEITVGGRVVVVRTSKIKGSPNYLYEAFVPEQVDPILQFISWPSDLDVLSALGKRYTHTIKPQLKP
jgi:hypothetical protein